MIYGRGFGEVMRLVMRPAPTMPVRRPRRARLTSESQSLSEAERDQTKQASESGRRATGWDARARWVVSACQHAYSPEKGVSVSKGSCRKSVVTARRAAVERLLEGSLARPRATFAPSPLGGE